MGAFSPGINMFIAQKYPVSIVVSLIIGCMNKAKVENILMKRFFLNEVSLFF
jgi:hypothetical protein